MSDENPLHDLLSFSHSLVIAADVVSLLSVRRRSDRPTRITLRLAIGGHPIAIATR